MLITFFSVFVIFARKKSKYFVNKSVFELWLSVIKSNISVTPYSINLCIVLCLSGVWFSCLGTSLIMSFFILFQNKVLFRNGSKIMSKNEIQVSDFK